MQDPLKWFRKKELWQQWYMITYCTNDAKIAELLKRYALVDSAPKFVEPQFEQRCRNCGRPQFEDHVRYKCVYGAGQWAQYGTE